MSRRFWFVYLFVLILFSCKPHRDLDQLVAEFSEIQCRAIALKNKRYQLSEYLRSIELDSILKKKEIDSLQLIIEITKNQSLVLADSIKIQLQNLFLKELVDKKKQKEFSIRLESFIRTNGCALQ